MTKRNIATKAAQPASEPFKKPRVSYDIGSQASIDLQQAVRLLTNLANIIKTSNPERLALAKQASEQAAAKQTNRENQATAERRALVECGVAQEKARVLRENETDLMSRLEALRISGPGKFNSRIPTPLTLDALAPVTLDLPNVTDAANQKKPAAEENQYDEPALQFFNPSIKIDLTKQITVQAACQIHPGHVLHRTNPFGGTNGRIECQLNNGLNYLSDNYLPKVVANYLSCVHAAVGIAVTDNHRPRVYINWQHGGSYIKLKQKNNSTDPISEEKPSEQLSPQPKEVSGTDEPSKTSGSIESSPTSPVPQWLQVTEAQVTHYALRTKAWENNNFLNISIELLVVKFLLVLLIDKINKKIKIKNSKKIPLNLIENKVFLLINLRRFFEYLACLSISFFCFAYVSKVSNVLFVQFLWLLQLVGRINRVEIVGFLTGKVFIFYKQIMNFKVFSIISYINQVHIEEFYLLVTSGITYILIGQVRFRLVSVLDNGVYFCVRSFILYLSLIFSLFFSLLERLHRMDYEMSDAKLEGIKTL